MIQFFDLKNDVHHAQATIKRSSGVNGSLSLSGEIISGDEVLTKLDYGWRLKFDDEKYVVSYKKLNNKTKSIEFDAVQEFFWDFSKIALHEELTGSHTFENYLQTLFADTGYTYNLDVEVAAFEQENWGYKNKLSLFNDIISTAGVEFEVHNEIVHITDQIGNDLTTIARAGINLSNLTEEMQISNFATYGKGYGAFVDSEDQSKGRLEVEYRSDLAKIYGDLETDPVVDERYTVEANLIAKVKETVDATYSVSVSLNLYDLKSAGYANYESPQTGDFLMAIDDSLNFKRQIRIIKLEETFTTTGKLIGYTATCGDLTAAEQYQAALGGVPSQISKIQKTVDSVELAANGKSKIYRGDTEPATANDGDLYFDTTSSDPDDWVIKQWVNGRWEKITLAKNEVTDQIDKATADIPELKAQIADSLAKADAANAKFNESISQITDLSSTVEGVKTDAATAGTNALTAINNAKTATVKAQSALDTATSTHDEIVNLTTVTDDLAGTMETLATKESLDKVSGTVSTLSTDVKLATDQISLKADRTTVDTLTKQVTSNTSSITANANAIKLKADQSTVDSLNGNVTSLSSEITAQANQIKLMVSKTDLATAVNGMATQTYVADQLKISSDEFSNTISQVRSDLDNIGGTNLLLNTYDYNGWGWSGSPSTATFNGTKIFQAGSQWGGPKYHMTDLNSRGVINTTDSFVYSTWVRNTSSIDGIQISLYCSSSTAAYITNDSRIGATLKANSGWVRAFVAFKFTDITPDVTIRLEPRQTPTGGLIEFAGQKLERGSIPTGYSPAPEDQATVEALSTVKQTVDSLSASLTDAQGNLTNLTATVNGYQATVTNQLSGLQSKQTSLANQYTSVVGAIDNKVFNPWFDDGQSSWDSGSVETDTNIQRISGHAKYLQLTARDAYQLDAKFPVTAGEIYYFDAFFGSWATTYPMAIGLNIILADGTQTWMQAFKFPAGAKAGMQSVSGKITIPANATYARPWANIDAPAAATDKGYGGLQGLRISKNANQASFTQLQSLIDANVTVAGKIAAQLSLSADGGGTALLAGNHVHITGETTIDTAAIKSAAIASLSADKLTAGTIDATKINVIGINANNITTGSITGANLSINLNTGRVSFNKGRISSSDNSLDINIDEGYIALTNNYDHSVLIKDGQLQFTQPNIFDPTQGEPYMSISNSMVGNGLHGASLLGRDYVAMSTNENMTSSLFGADSIMGAQTFAGFGVGKNYKTVIGGANRGVFISGGQQINNSDALHPSPSISIGTDAQGVNSGNRIVLKGEYVHAMAVQYQTTSGSSNVFVAADGALVRVTSALKYKDQVERTYDDSIAEKLITLPTATWMDKAEMARYNNDPVNQPVPERHFGMIAEDLAAAGIEELVVRNNGELEGIEYDRIGPALVPLIRKLYDRVEKLEESQNAN